LNGFFGGQLWQEYLHKQLIQKFDQSL